MLEKVLEEIERLHIRILKAHSFIPQERFMYPQML